MMAFERMEPFGSLHEETMAGSLCALLANIHRREGAPAMGASDFMPGLARAQAAREPVKRDDPQEQSELLLAALFPAAAKSKGLVRKDIPNA